MTLSEHAESVAARSTNVLRRIRRRL